MLMTQALAFLIAYRELMSPRIPFAVVNLVFPIVCLRVIGIRVVSCCFSLHCATAVTLVVFFDLSAATSDVVARVAAVVEGVLFAYCCGDSCGAGDSCSAATGAVVDAYAIENSYCYSLFSMLY